MPCIDRKGIKGNSASVVILEPHPASRKLDHNFDSRTYEGAKMDAIEFFFLQANK